MSETQTYPRLKIIENGRVSPPLSSIPTTSVPLSYFDIPWMLNFFSQVVSFYEFPVSSSDFTQKVVPALKSSLSIALKHFYPLAGKLVVPPLPDKPHILYNEGDSVPFTVAESMEDFHELISNDPQDVKLLHPLIVPQLPPWDVSEDDGICTRGTLLSIQVTLFPNTGICLGMQFNHAVCDGRSSQHFTKSWASICKTGDLHSSLVPFLDRGIFEDPNDLQTTLFKSNWNSKVVSSDGLPPVCAKQRATFVLSRATINRLKGWISNKSTMLSLQPMNISSFATACAFTWVCIEKSTYDDHSSSKEPQLCIFSFSADCRKRLETPVNESYFGNCLVPCVIAMDKKILLGRDGIVLAARAIAQKVIELENGGRACTVTRIERCFSESSDARNFGIPLSISGSPQLDFFDADFGWGRVQKFAFVYIDRRRCISFVKSRHETGALEIGVALTKVSMVTFTSLFTQLETFITDSLMSDHPRAKL